MPLTFERYMAALKAGHTFVTTGPMLLLTVNGKMPGDTLDVAAGSRVKISAEAFGTSGRTLRRSILGHSKVLARTEGKDAAHLTVEFELPADHGIWIAAKCEGGIGQVAHTTPVYVTVGAGFENRETLSPESGYGGGIPEGRGQNWRIRNAIWTARLRGIRRNWSGRSRRPGACWRRWGVRIGRVSSQLVEVRRFRPPALLPDPSVAFRDADLGLLHPSRGFFRLRAPILPAAEILLVREAGPAKILVCQEHAGVLVFVVRRGFHCLKGGAGRSEQARRTTPVP